MDDEPLSTPIFTGPKARDPINANSSRKDKAVTTKKLPKIQSPFGKTEETRENEQDDSYEHHDTSRGESVPRTENDDNDETRQELSYVESISRRNSVTPSPELKIPPKANPLPKSVEPEAAPNPGLFNPWVIIVIIVGICMALGTAKNFMNPSPAPQPNPQRCDKFRALARNYPSVDPMIWNTLIVSVNRAIYRNPGEPATFIFLDQGSQNSLLEEIIGITATCFGGRKPIRLQSTNFETPEIIADHHTFVADYKERLEVQGILVVRDLDQVPPRAARAFFHICDSYEPLVNRAVIFFTVDISNRPDLVADNSSSATAIAEQVLKDRWRRELGVDMLNPLLTRLTENVFKI